MIPFRELNGRQITSKRNSKRQEAGDCGGAVCVYQTVSVSPCQIWDSTISAFACVCAYLYVCVRVCVCVYVTTTCLRFCTWVSMQILAVNGYLDPFTVLTARYDIAECANFIFNFFFPSFLYFFTNFFLSSTNSKVHLENYKLRVRSPYYWYEFINLRYRSIEKWWHN